MHDSRIFEMQHLNSKSTWSGLTDLHNQLTVLNDVFPEIKYI